MANRYLLESGAPDGYLLEDGTGVLLLEATDVADGGGSGWSKFLVITTLLVSSQQSLAAQQVGSYHQDQVPTVAATPLPVDDTEWRAPTIQQLGNAYPQPWSGEQHEPGNLVAALDWSDGWPRLVWPDPQPRLLWSDHGELPVAAAPALTVDEQAPPLAPMVLDPQYLPAPFAYGGGGDLAFPNVVHEDDWLPPPPWARVQPRPVAWQADDITIFVPLVEDLDLPVILRPWPGTLVPFPWIGEQHEQATNLVGVPCPPEEVAYTAPILPLPINAYPLPWQGEQHEDAANLHGAPTEAYWQNPVAPTSRALRALLPWLFEQHETAVLWGQPPEDYQVVLPRPVPRLLRVPLPWTWELHFPVAPPTSIVLRVVEAGAERYIVSDESGPRVRVTDVGVPRLGVEDV